MVAIITLGMVLPAFPVALGGNLIVASFTYDVFLTVLAFGFGVAGVVLLEWLSLDRITFAFASIAWPWVVFFTAFLRVLLLNEGEQIPEGHIANIVRTIYRNDWIWGAEPTTELAYGAFFMIAGVGAVVVSSLLEPHTHHLMEHSA